MLEVSRHTNMAKIIIDGKVLASFDDMTLDSWGDVLYSLQKIYNQLIQQSIIANKLDLTTQR